MIVSRRNALVASAILIAGIGSTAVGLSVASADPICRVTDESATQGCAAIMPPCAVEDSVGPCYWDAANRGNHEGRSFVAIPDMGVIPVA